MFAVKAMADNRSEPEVVGLYLFLSPALSHASSIRILEKEKTVWVEEQETGKIVG